MAHVGYLVHASLVDDKVDERRDIFRAHLLLVELPELEVFASVLEMPHTE